MFKIETLVGLLVFTLIIHPAHAQTPPPGYGDASKGACNGVVEAWTKKRMEAVQEEDAAKRQKLEAAAAKLSVLVDECTRKIGVGADAQDCGSKANDDYTKARAAFSSACSAAGYPQSRKNNYPVCAYEIEQCNKCARKNVSSSDPPEDVSCDDAPSGGSDRAESTSDGSSLLNTGNMARVAHYCPARIAKDADKLEKYQNEERKELKDLEKKLPELQKKYTDAINNGEKEVSDIQERQVEAQNELEEGLEQAKQKQDASVKAITDQIFQIEGQIAQKDKDIRQVELSKKDAENTFHEALKQIDLNCHASASATIAKFQEERLKVERANKLNRGSFDSILRNVGMTDREAWQKQAEKYYRWCLISKPTRDSKDTAKKIYLSALDKADEAIRSLNNDKKQLQAGIEKLRNNNGCAPSGGMEIGAVNDRESETCKAMKNAVNEAMKIRRKHDTKQQKLAADIAKARQKAMTEANAAQAEAAMVQRQMADARTRMNNYKKAADIANDAAGRADKDSKAQGELSSKYAEFTAAASKYVSCELRARRCTGECATLKDWLARTGSPVSEPVNASDNPSISPNPPTDNVTATTEDPPDNENTGHREATPPASGPRRGR